MLPAMAQDVADADAPPVVAEAAPADAPAVSVEKVPVEQPVPPPPPEAPEAPEAVDMPVLQVESEQPTLSSGVSEAEEYLRRGVELYKKDLYKEALTEFNRALALDPSLESARSFQEKANTKLQQAAAGVETQAPAEFQTVDPAELRAKDGKMELSADEIRRDRVRELMGYGQRYMEAEHYNTAVEIYSNVLLIDPGMPRQKRLHKATLGATINPLPSPRTM